MHFHPATLNTAEGRPVRPYALKNFSVAYRRCFLRLVLQFSAFSFSRDGAVICITAVSRAQPLHHARPGCFDKAKKDAK
jgi:hypothetical protein